MFVRTERLLPPAPPCIQNDVASAYVMLQDEQKVLETLVGPAPCKASEQSWRRRSRSWAASHFKPLRSTRIAANSSCVSCCRSMTLIARAVIG